MSDEITEAAQQPALPKRNLYAEAADPARYRVADAPLFTCAEHTAACVLCTTAGKNGRNGRTAAVGATLFWLTCHSMNALIARWEGRRCVQAVAEAMKRHTCLRQWHIDSHALYAARAQELLSESQWLFFKTHFLSEVDAQLHKYGNAAVSHAEDMKCLHALVAQTLASAPNPIGSLMLNYTVFLHQLATVAEAKAAQEEGRRQGLRDALDKTELFNAFLETSIAQLHGCYGNGWTRASQCTLTVHLPDPEVLEVSSVSYEWQPDSALAALSPDLCARAMYVLTFLEGKPPRRRKKHRIN